MTDITPLIPWLNEPYQKNRVLDAARAIGYPFTLSEAVEASGLPIHTVNRVLERLVRQRVLARRRMSKAYPTFVGGRGGGGRWVAAGRVRRVYLYSFVEGSE